jgi:hypothetical protein
MIYEYLLRRVIPRPMTKETIRHELGSGTAETTRTPKIKPETSSALTPLAFYFFRK